MSHHIRILKQADYVNDIMGGRSKFYYAVGQEHQLLDRLKDDNLSKTLENAIVSYKKSLRLLVA
ncbi:MAG: hypothetical protein AABW84_01330 [Nanoarchaeota archaeon]